MSRTLIGAAAIVIVGGTLVAMVRAQESGPRSGRSERSILSRGSDEEDLGGQRPATTAESTPSASTSRIAERLKRLRNRAETPSATADTHTEPGLLTAPRNSSQLEKTGPRVSTRPNSPSSSTSVTRSLHSIKPSAVSRQAKTDSSKRVLMESSGPAIRVQTVGPKAIVIGKQAGFTVHLNNDGRESADEVLVRISLPPWLELVSNDATIGTVKPQQSPTGHHLIWSTTELRSKTNATLDLQVVPRQNRPFELTVDWTLRPTASVTEIEVQQPALEMVVSGPKDILFGEKAAYSIHLSNPGTGDAEDVSIDFSYGTNKLPSKTVGVLAAGGEVDMKVELTARQAGLLDISAVARADGGLISKVDEQVLVRRGRLEVEVVGAQMKFAGSVANYQVRVRNSGDATASNVVASIILPDGAKYIGNKKIDAEANSLSTALGTLAAGSEKVFQLACQLNLPGDNVLRARAEADLDLSESDSAMTRVKALADLKLAVNDPQGPTAVGDKAAYELEIVNRGTKSATDVNVVAQFSAGVEPQVTDGTRARVVPGQVIFQPIRSIAPGETVRLKITAVASKPGNHRFRAEVKCTNPDTVLVAEESTYFFTSETVSTKPVAAEVR